MGARWGISGGHVCLQGRTGGRLFVRTPGPGNSSLATASGFLLCSGPKKSRNGRLKPVRESGSFKTIFPWVGL
jgi:hypothetical protein